MDPYYSAKNELEVQLENASGSLNRLKAIGEDNSDYGRQRRELKRNLSVIEEDLEDLSQTVEIISGNLERFKLTEEEYAARCRFVKSATEMLNKLKETLPRQKQSQNIDSMKDSLAPEGGDEVEQLLMEQDDAMMRQNEELEQLSHAVVRVKEVSGAINEEIKTQDTLLDKLTGKVEAVTDRMRQTNKKVDKIVEKMSTKRQYACIALLVVVLVILCVLTIS
eukprot:TRINITY_DN3216_c0_g1_i1.p3 TRINITY_DN3216_c0_g1~~TRINITY_DN3216_c0_g1_i1.p3  ORF type:complete len:222 (+),score=55.93 TRINITY_DN3216_c0_g1_i1:990-1655(+)